MVLIANGIMREKGREDRGKKEAREEKRNDKLEKKWVHILKKKKPQSERVL